MPISHLPMRCLLLALLAPLGMSQLPSTFKYGTSLGGWLLSEPWMKPVEWKEMGGEYCPQDSSSCAASEWSLTKKLGQEAANEAFLKHWQSWFNQKHVNQLKSLKLDHIRIPLGFWIIEELVEAPAEMYAQGGWMELKRGLRQLRDAGFHVILDMHALPGVSTPNQQFAGNVTSDAQFYKDHNYQRALTWSAIMTAMIHLDPDFQSVVGIECINEPQSDATLTPGLGQYYSDFVTTTRAIEYAVGAPCEADLSAALPRLSKSKNALVALDTAIRLIPIYAAKACPKIDAQPLISRLEKFCSLRKGKPSTTSEPSFGVSHTSQKLSSEAIKKRSHGGHLHHRSIHHAYLTRRNPMSQFWRGTTDDDHSEPTFGVARAPKGCIATMAMPKRWQSKGEAVSLAPYTIGPAAYGDHLYFSYGGVADANFKSYMETICNIDHFEKAKENGEVPYGHGEFSVATNFNATHDQIRAWGDAQRFMYNKEKYWTFWNFRLGTAAEPDLTPQFINSWSYLAAVEAGLWPKDPSDYFTRSVCKPYFKVKDAESTNHVTSKIGS